MEPDFYHQALEELEKRKREVQSSLDDCIIAQQAKDSFPKIVITCTMHPLEFDYNGPMLLCQLKNMEDVKQIIRFLAEKGYHQTKPPQDNPLLHMRRWFFGRMLIMGMFFGDGASCRYIQTGVKEEPVYELHCDEVPEKSINRLESIG